MTAPLRFDPTADGFGAVPAWAPAPRRCRPRTQVDGEISGAACHARRAERRPLLQSRAEKRQRRSSSKETTHGDPQHLPPTSAFAFRRRPATALPNWASDDPREADRHDVGPGAGFRRSFTANRSRAPRLDPTRPHELFACGARKAKRLSSTSAIESEPRARAAVRPNLAHREAIAHLPALVREWPSAEGGEANRVVSGQGRPGFHPPAPRRAIARVSSFTPTRWARAPLVADP